MRRAAKVDANQAEVVRALRAIGATVQSLATVGQGCPDLLVGYHGRNYLMEVKDGNKPPSAQKLTADEEHWIESWRGEVRVVNNIEWAIKAVTGGDR